MFSNNSLWDFTDHINQGHWMIIAWDSFIVRFVNWNNGSSLPRIWYNPMRERESEKKICSNTGASSGAQFVHNEVGTQSGPAAELGDSSCMASIMISLFNLISVKNIFYGQRNSNNLFWVRSGEDSSKLIY